MKLRRRAGCTWTVRTFARAACAGDWEKPTMTGTHLLQIFGPPAAGKSTLANALLEHSTVHTEQKVGAAWVTWWANTQAPDLWPVCEFGRADNQMGFRGSDRLTMNAIVHLKKWVDSMEHDQIPRLVFVEGDRFADEKFIRWASDYWNVWPIALHIPDEEVLIRMGERFLANGSSWKFKTRKSTGLPSPTWTKGRIKKAANLQESRFVKLVLDGTLPTADLVRALEGIRCPVVDTMRNLPTAIGRQGQWV